MDLTYIIYVLCPFQSCYQGLRKASIPIEIPRRFRLARLLSGLNRLRKQNEGFSRNPRREIMTPKCPPALKIEDPEYALSILECPAMSHYISNTGTETIVLATKVMIISFVLIAQSSGLGLKP